MKPLEARVGAEAGVQHPRARAGRARCGRRTSSSSQSRLETSMLPANSAKPARARAGAAPSRRGRRRRPTRAPSRAGRTTGRRSGRTPRAPPSRRRRRPLRAARAPRRSPPRCAAGTPRLAVRVGDAVGSSVFRYSSPCAARSSPSSACAAPPTHSGCQAEKTSWWKPGSVISAVLIAPPSQSFRSSTQTLQPAAREQRGAGERVDPAADDDGVVARDAGTPLR